MNDVSRAEVMTIDDARRKYEGLWVAGIVVRRDESLQPQAVRVVASHPDRYRLRDSIDKGLDYCIFFGGCAVKEGYGFL